MLGLGVQLFFKLCSDHLAVEAIPRGRVRIDLVKAKDDLSAEYCVAMWTPHFLVLKGLSGEEITVRKDGRMVVRHAGSEERARAAATRVLSLLSVL
jgi:alkylhydroperoxidase family enzyme